MKLHKGDSIIVLSGKDKGRKGKISAINVKTHTVTVPGINMYKRHLKRRDDKHPGGIIDMIRPILEEKVALVCPKCNHKTRIGYLIVGNEKERICKKCRQKV